MSTPKTRQTILRQLERYRRGRQIDIQRALQEGAVTRADLARAGLTEEAQRRQRARQRREVPRDQPPPPERSAPTPAPQQPTPAPAQPGPTPQQQALSRLQEAGVVAVDGQELTVEDVDAALEGGHREDLLAVGFTAEQLAPPEGQAAPERPRERRDTSLASRLRETGVTQGVISFDLGEAVNNVRANVRRGRIDPEAPITSQLAQRRAQEAINRHMSNLAVEREQVEGKIAAGERLERQGRERDRQALIDRGRELQQEGREALQTLRPLIPQVRQRLQAAAQDEIARQGGQAAAAPISDVRAAVQAGTSPLVREGLAEVTEQDRVRVDVAEAVRQGFREEVEALGFSDEDIRAATVRQRTAQMQMGDLQAEAQRAMSRIQSTGVIGAADRSALETFQQAQGATPEEAAQAVDALRGQVRTQQAAAGDARSQAAEVSAQDRSRAIQRLQGAGVIREEDGEFAFEMDPANAIARGHREDLDTAFGPENVNEILAEGRQVRALARQLEEFATASQFETFERPPDADLDMATGPRFATQLQQEADALDALRELDEEGFMRDGGILVRRALRSGVPIATLERAGVPEAAIQEGLQGQPTGGPAPGGVPQPRVEAVPEQAVGRFQQLFDALQSGVDLGPVSDFLSPTQEVPESDIDPDRIIVLDEESQGFVGGTPAVPLAGVPVPRLPGLPQVRTPLGATGTTVAIGAAAITAELLRRNPELRERLSGEAQEFVDQVFQSTERTQVTPGEVSPPGFARVQVDTTLPGATLGTPPETVEIPPQRVEPPSLPGISGGVPPEVVRVLERANEVVEAEASLSNILAPVERARVAEGLAAAREAADAEGQRVAVPIDQVIDRALQNVDPDTRRRSRIRLQEVERRRRALEEAQRSLVASQGFPPGSFNDPQALRAAVAASLATPASILARRRATDLPEAEDQPQPTVVSTTTATPAPSRSLAGQVTGVAHSLDSEGQTGLASRLRADLNAATAPASSTLTRTQPLQQTLNRVATSSGVTTRTATRAATLSQSLAGAQAVPAAGAGGGPTIRIPTPDPGDDDQAPAVPEGQHPRIVGVSRGAVGETAVDLGTGAHRTVQDIDAVPNRPTKESFTVLTTDETPTGPRRVPWGALDQIIFPDGDQVFVKAGAPLEDARRKRDGGQPKSRPTPPREARSRPGLQARKRL